MSAHPTAVASAAPAGRQQAAIAAEVRLACDALERAVAAGKGLRDDVRLEIVVDDLVVIASHLALVHRDLQGLAR